MFHKKAIQFFNWLFPHPSQGLRSKFLIHSKEVGDEFEIWVDLPVQGVQNKGPLPVLIYTDANLPTSRRLNPIVRELLGAGLLPPMILVGIAHHDNLLWKRNRDFIQGRKFADGRWVSRGNTFGKAQAFYDFLAGELIPEIRRRYAVTENWTLMGHSLAGSFSLYSMLQKKPVFNNYFALSPAVWMYRRNLLKIAKYFQAQGGELKGNVYFSAGGLEAINMVLYSAKAYHSFLKEHGTERLKLAMDVFPRRNHFNSVKHGIRNGLLWMASQGSFQNYPPNPMQGFKRGGGYTDLLPSVQRPFGEDPIPTDLFDYV